MQGLKKQENEKFNKFWEIVQNEAERNEARFFLDCGEGREFSTDTMEGEDLSGWLIPNKEAEEFEKLWKAGEDIKRFSEFICFAEWEKMGENIVVEFVRY